MCLIGNQQSMGVITIKIDSRKPFHKQLLQIVNSYGSKSNGFFPLRVMLKLVALGKLTTTQTAFTEKQTNKNFKLCGAAESKSIKSLK